MKNLNLISSLSMVLFSNISEAAQLFISAVQHKPFIEVNESGTEAAAATSVDPNAPLQIKVDRPFLFVIREKQANNILFLGKMMNPAKK